MVLVNLLHASNFILHSKGCAHLMPQIVLRGLRHILKLGVLTSPSVVFIGKHQGWSEVMWHQEGPAIGLEDGSAQRDLETLTGPSHLGLKWIHDFDQDWKRNDYVSGWQRSFWQSDVRTGIKCWALKWIEI